MVWSEIALICVSVVLVAILVAWVITARKNKQREIERQSDGVEIIDGVRYTKSNTTEKSDGEIKVSLNKGDIMLERGKEYKVGDGALLAGKYTVLSGDENIGAVNIRIGGLVREYKHSSSVVLTDGDTISPVSANIVLR